MIGYLPVLVTIIGAIAAGITYLVQKKIDRRESLLKEKKEAYRAYLAALTDVSRDALYTNINEHHAGTLNETNARASHAYDSIQLYASAKVMLAAVETESALIGWRQSLTQECKHGDMDARRTFLNARALLLSQMRIELFGDEKVELSTASGLLDLLGSRIRRDEKETERLTK